MFIDYGSTIIIDLQRYALHPIEEVSDMLALYPPQALQVEMALSTIPKKFGTILRDVLPPDVLVIVKVVGNEGGKVQRVEFFHRSQQGLLVSVNQFLDTPPRS